MKNEISDHQNKLLAELGPGDNAPPFTVSELSASLKRSIEDQFGRVRIKGELSGYKRATSGHCYFGIKDENALIDGVMWKGNANRLPFAAEDGLEIIATGKITTFPGRSKYQIVVENMELAGEGALMMLFEKLKARLADEGLFDNGRKKKLPYLPAHIGVITSPTGAVIRDILHRLADRFPVRVTLWPVKVQGDGAAEEIAHAINGFSNMEKRGDLERPDLLIIGRGGGSIEDLWAFNEEAVVRAIANCTIPTISAVGHETDTSLSDYAADRRAPTPTAAAEMAVPVRSDLQQKLGQLALRSQNAMARGLSLASERLSTQKRLMPNLDNITAPYQQRADDAAMRLQGSFTARLNAAELKFSALQSGLRPQILMRHWENKNQQLVKTGLKRKLADNILDKGAQKLSAFDRLLKSLHPQKPLERGFAMITNMEGKLLPNLAEAQQFDAMKVQFADGQLSVQQIKGHKGGGDGDDNPKKTQSVQIISSKHQLKKQVKKNINQAADNQGNLF
ncbi:exodeoxyribonuclease VII large subunit [Sphingorhabdus lutea]|nr:exodeoxyribonuclease VII large subunit [Sphingorhabdus lutea]